MSSHPISKNSLTLEVSEKIQLIMNSWRVDSLEKTLMLGGLGAGGEGEDRGWDGWMALLTRWTWVWVNSGSWWWRGRPGVLRFMGSQRVGHDWVTELNWTEDHSGNLSDSMKRKNSVIFVLMSRGRMPLLPLSCTGPMFQACTATQDSLARPPACLPVSLPPFFSNSFLNIYVYLCIWLCWVLFTAYGIFNLCCGMWDLYLQHVLPKWH